MGFLNAHLSGVNAIANRFYRTLRLYLANRSLRAWGKMPVYLARRLLNRSVPTYVCIAPTYRCQCHCPHCYSDASSTGRLEELDTEQFKSVIDQSVDLGVLQVNLSAGEPLLREDIEELVKHAHDAGLITRVNTNGLLLDRERVFGLKEAGLAQCGISIDDADARVHDALRGVPGAFEP